jgi:hypothetical protein
MPLLVILAGLFPNSEEIVHSSECEVLYLVSYGLAIEYSARGQMRS